LTAAVGWTIAVATLGALSDRLTSGLALLIDRAMAAPAVVSVDQDAVVAQIREQVAVVVFPLLTVLASFAAGALAAHQVQVRGLWATQLLVPDPGRLWARGAGQHFSALAGGTLWALVKTITLAITLLALFGAAGGEILNLGGLEGVAVARAAGQVLSRAAWILASVLLVLGLVDYAIRFRRLELTLRTTAQQEREDQRVMQGDPAGRAQRFRVAQTWRGDSPDVLAGATVVLTGRAGLTLVLAGGPPPRLVSVRIPLKGHVGRRTRRSAEAKNIPVVEAPDLASRLARRPPADASGTAELIAELASIWPSS
jgi:flagellar biosynthetic protein FlhB